MKDFFEFVKRESEEFRAPLIFFAVFAGVVNGLAVSVAIRTVFLIQPGFVNVAQLVKLAACVGCFWISKEYVLNRTISIVEDIVERIRYRILEKIRGTELLAFENMDAGRIFSTLSTDAITISMSAAIAINACSSLVMLLFIVILIGSLSIHALMLTMGMILLAVVFYLRKSKDVANQLIAASIKENAFYDNLSGVLNGFKEFKLNRAKADDFYKRELSEVIEETSKLRVVAGKSLNQSVLIGQTFLFFTIAALLFILPTVKPSDIPIIGILVPVILFSAGPIGEIVAAIPAISKAQASIYNIRGLEDLIDSSISQAEQEAEQVAINPVKYEKIEMKNISFQYPKNGSRPFTIQPFDFEITPGEIVFVVGGNGSGKSTFLKLLTGLYRSETGTVMLNSSPVEQKNIADYRNLFSPIFTDFYLFKRILGIKDIELKPTQQMLEKFELAGKTEISNGVISDINLSTGQKKRLALIIATLDDRPICIFDEWAADQDPVFRKYFYDSILPELKKSGKTVVAVTHDDHYFDRADRIYEMDYGSFVPFSGGLHKE